jgi:hypothetical protein
MSSLSPKDRVSLCLFTFTDGRRCRTRRTGRHPHFCFYHAQKEVRPSCGKTRQRSRLSLLWRLPFRLRSQHRPFTPHPRRGPRRYKTQTRPHRRLHGANPHADHPPLPGRIHQRLRHRRLAQSRPHFRQRQPRLPLPARPRTRPTRTIASPAPNPTPGSTCDLNVCRGRACPARPNKPAQRTGPSLKFRSGAASARHFRTSHTYNRST